MLLETLIDLKSGAKLKYNGTPVTVVRISYVKEEVGKDEDGVPYYRKDFDMYAKADDGGYGVCLHSSHPNPKVLNLTEFTDGNGRNW